MCVPETVKAEVTTVNCGPWKVCRQDGVAVVNPTSDTSYVHYSSCPVCTHIPRLPPVLVGCPVRKKKHHFSTDEEALDCICMARLEVFVSCLVLIKSKHFCLVLLIQSGTPS